jgi:hypothetical protein
MVNKNEGKKVLVTTQYRGVFFGEIVENNAPKSIKLKDARNCVYWESSLHGFIGLASAGPSSGCKIGPKADIELYDVTSVVECTPEAISKWEKGLWA